MNRLVVPNIIAVMFLLMLSPIVSYAENVRFSTDRSTYSYGDTITITGKIKSLQEGKFVILQIINPKNSDVVIIDQFQLNNQGTFSKNYRAEGSKWNIDGNYTLRLFYDKWFEKSIPFNTETVSRQTPAGDLVEFYQRESYAINQDHIDNESGIADSIIPSWIKNSAKQWADGEVGDADFVYGIHYLITQKIIQMPETRFGTGTPQEIPAWIKNSATWWSEGKISDDDFISGVQFLISNGIMKI